MQLYLFGLDGRADCDPVKISLLPLGAWDSHTQAAAPLELAFLAPTGSCMVATSDGNGNVAARILPENWLATAAAGWTGVHIAVWLLDARRSIASSTGDLMDALPTMPIMASLLAGPGLVRGNSASRHRYAYAATDLLNDWKLIVAIDATPEYRHALRILAMRSFELAALLLTGLAAIVFGADVAFGAPLRRLNDSVHHWRAGDEFSPGNLTGAPDEVRQLATSFAEATAGLRNKEAELIRAYERQTLLMLEVHHRVKNNLQIVASLLNLQASRIRAPEARAEFQAARDRVRALATLHRHLYADGELHTLNMRSFLVEMCGQLFQAAGETEGTRIKLLIEAPDMRLSSDEAVPLALIVTEIVTNAVNYAFPGGRMGRICVNLRQSDKDLTLEISDDGVGLNRVPDAESARNGIGMRLIHGFSRQLGATLHVNHGNGTSYTIRLPRRKLSQQLRVDMLDAAMSAGENG